MSRDDASEAEPALVHVVDDDAALRAALDRLFRSVGLAAMGHASVPDFLAAERPDRAGCMVLDIRMPQMTGLEFQARFEALGIAMPVIFMTGFGDIPSSVHAMKRGAVDFLPKPFREQDMLEAVGRAVERDRARREKDRSVAYLKGLHDALTPRERQVMGLVVSGLLNREIAATLALSEVTVKIHRGAMMRKMRATSVADLVRASNTLGVG